MLVNQSYLWPLLWCSLKLTLRLSLYTTKDQLNFTPLMCEALGISYTSCLGPLWKYMWTVSSCLMRCSRQAELQHLDPNSSVEGSQGHSGRAIHILPCLKEALRDVSLQILTLSKNWMCDRTWEGLHIYTRFIWHFYTNWGLMENQAASFYLTH